MQRMTRQSFFATLAAPFAAAATAAALPAPALAHMYINFRTRGPHTDGRRNLALPLLGSRCYVDGHDVQLVWYVDTFAGVVKSYDVCGDGRARAWRDYLRDQWRGPAGYPAGSPLFDGSPLEGVGELVSVTLRGRIEIFASNGKRIF